MATIEVEHEVIMVLANTGFADVIMTAAREEGAKGGTIIRARGAGNSTIAKKYGLAITPEKEIVFILVKVEIRDKIIEAINKVAGLETNAHGVMFSLPVSNVTGLKFY